MIEVVSQNWNDKLLVYLSTLNNTLKGVVGVYLLPQQDLQKLDSSVLAFHKYTFDTESCSLGVLGGKDA